MNDQFGVATVIEEIAYELALWPIPPEKILHIGDSKASAIANSSLKHTNLTLLFSDADKNIEDQPLWLRTDWDAGYDVILCIDFLGEYKIARTPDFFQNVKRSLSSSGRLIAIESNIKVQPVAPQIISAANKASCRITSSLTMHDDDRWTCFVIQPDNTL